MAAVWQRPITMYSLLLMTQTLTNSNLTPTLSKTPLDYLYTFSVILPYVTRTMFLISMWQVDKESVLQSESETLNIFQITIVFVFCQGAPFKYCVQSCVLIKLSSVHDTCVPSLFHFFISSYLLWTPANSNFFSIFLEGSSYGESTLHAVMNLASRQILSAFIL